MPNPDPSVPLSEPLTPAELDALLRVNETSRGLQLLRVEDVRRLVAMARRSLEGQHTVVNDPRNTTGVAK